jgi:ankyrin repeat protein
MEEKPEHWNITGCNTYGNEYNTTSYPVIDGSLSNVKKTLGKVPENNIKAVLAAVDYSNEYTALHYAAINEKLDICEYLLSIGAENDIKYRNILAKKVDVKQILANVDKSYWSMSVGRYGNR